ncbi:MAG: endonuclease/exonuclease/phosphatase family protein [Arsenophonus sp. NC-WZS1-MAG3]
MLTIRLNGSHYEYGDLPRFGVSSSWTPCASARGGDALDDTPLPTLVAGDLNAKYPSWNSRVRNSYGRSLYRFVGNHPNILVIGPDSHTFFPTQRGFPSDVLDIAIAKNISNIISVTAVADLSSDHDPLLITVRALSDSPRLPDRPARRVNWRSYHDELSRR